MIDLIYFSLAYSPPLLVVSGDGNRLLVVVNTCEVYIWEKEPSQSLLWPKRPTVQGTWSRIMPDQDVLLPTSDCKECCTSAVFYVRKGVSSQICRPCLTTYFN